MPPRRGDPPRVLVTDGSPSGQGRSALAAVRALRAGGYAVGVTVSGRWSLAAASRDCDVAVRAPAADAPDYSTVVSAIAAEYGATAILPASDAALLALSAPGHWLVDKRRLAALASRAGLQTPPARVFEDGAHLAREEHTLRFPSVVKVSRKAHVSGPAATVVNDRASLRAWRDVRDPVVVEAVVDGTMSAVFGIAWRGRLLALGYQRYLRTWPVVCGVSSAAITEPLPADVPVDRLARLLDGYDGIFQAQFVGSTLIDVNPRVYGSMPLAVAAGANLPARWCDLRRGLGVPAVTPRPGVRYRWVEGDLRWFVGQVRSRGPHAVVDALVPHRSTAHSVASLRDPAPLVHRLAYASGLVRGRRHVIQPRDVASAGDLDVTVREQQLLAPPHLPTSVWDAVPSSETAAVRHEALAIVQPAAERLGASVREGPLSSVWSTDLDLHVGSAPGDLVPVRRALGGMDGLLSLDLLLGRLGSSAKDQWLVHEDGRGLARLDVQFGPAPDPIDRLVTRHRAGRPMGVREVLELRRLVAQGRPLPHGRAVARVAGIEARLGGALLHDAARRGPLERLALAARRPRRPHVRRHRVIVAFSGLDGAGKSSQVTRLRASLERAGVPVHVVWTRPGMQLRWLHPVRRAVKRLLGEPEEPGLRAMGRRGARMPRTRRGLLGHAWSSMVVAAYLWASRLPRRFRVGVVVYDRHLLDALATLHSVYDGAAMAWQRAALRRLLPEADVTILLDVAVDVAAARKPDAVFNRRLLERQQEVYANASSIVPDVVVLDGTSPSNHVSEQVLRHLLQTGGGGG